MKKYICPVCRNEEHPDRVRFCIVCGNALPIQENPEDEPLETVKLLALAAIAYQRMFDEILRSAKGNPTITDLLMNVPTIQGTPNVMKVYALAQSGLDVNAIKSIDEVIVAMNPKRSGAT